MTSGAQFFFSPHLAIGHFGRVFRSDYFLDCFLFSLGGGWSAREKSSRSKRAFYGSSRYFIFPRGKIDRFRFLLVTTCFRSRVRLVLDQRDTERPVLGSRAEGMCMIARHWPQFMDMVGRRPLSGMRCGLITLGATSKKKATSKKSQHNAHPRITFAGRVQSKLDNFPCFWDASRECE